jgi:CRP-like cAMP-binding protein
MEWLQKIHTQLKDKIFVIRKNVKTVPMFIEYCKLEPGKAFGEQALLKNNEPALRAATIRCTKDCYFAVMAKEDFQNILKNKIRKSKLDQMEVLQSLPFFRVWTKT